MTDINNVVLVGRLVRNAELGYLPNGTAKADISVAVNRSVKRGDQWQEEVSYFDVIVWGRMAENLAQKMCKGVKLAVTGSLKQDRWKDQNGNNRSAIKIIAENVQLLGAPMGNQMQYPNQRPMQNYPEQVQQLAESFGGDVEGYTEDLPF